MPLTPEMGKLRLRESRHPPCCHEISGSAGTRASLLWLLPSNEFSTLAPTCSLSLRSECFAASTCIQFDSKNCYRVPTWGPLPEPSPCSPGARSNCMLSIFVMKLAFAGKGPFSCGDCWAVVKVPITGQIFLKPSSLQGTEAILGTWFTYLMPPWGQSIFFLPSKLLSELFPLWFRDRWWLWPLLFPSGSLECSRLTAGVVLSLGPKKGQILGDHREAGVGACVGGIKRVWGGGVWTGLDRTVGIMVAGAG